MAILCAALLATTPTVLAQTVTASNGLSCAGDRFGSNLGCTAGEFTSIVTIQNQSGLGSPTSCVVGEVVTLIATVQLSGSNADRYDIGFFAGESGNDPGNIVAGGKCSVATFPTSPAPWFAKDADACGDYPGGGNSTPVITNLKLLCDPDASGKLKVPYLLAYNQNSGGVCTGPANVVAGSSSKCNKGVALVDVVGFTVNGSVNLTKRTVPSGSTQNFVFTASGTGAVPATDASFSLQDGQAKSVKMAIGATANTLTITEGATNFWESSAAISCVKPDGSAAAFVTVNNASRQISASLTTANPVANCTITNTKRSRVTLVENISGRVGVTDKFTLSAAGGGTFTDTAGAAMTSPVSVSTTSTSTTAQRTFWSTPGQALNVTLSSSPTAISGYNANYSCTNAATSSTVMPSGSGASFSLSPAAGDDITCTYTASPAGVAPTVDSFNAFETAAAANAVAGSIRTKLAGSAFSLDLVAISAGAQFSAFAGSVKVELINGSSNCTTSSNVIQSIASTTIPGGRSTVNFPAVADAYPDVRVRISYPASSPTAAYCSNDNFAIRPATLALAVTDTDWATSGNARVLGYTSATSGVAAILHKAGQDFTFTSVARNAAGSTTANYVGTPTLVLSQCAGTACTASFGSLNRAASTFTAGALSTTATYSEVGAFALTLTDTDFAAVDASDGTPATCDNTAPIGRYVCSATIDVGRFVPDHLAVTGSVVTRSDLQASETQAIPFSYMGEPMLLSLQLIPYAKSDGAIRLYAGALAKLDAATLGVGSQWFNTGSNCASTTQCMGLGAVQGANGLSARLAIDTSAAYGSATPASSWQLPASGSIVGTFTANLVFSRPTSAVSDASWGPFDSLSVGAMPRDADGVTLPDAAASDTGHRINLDATTGDLLASNPDGAIVERRLLFNMAVRYGRLRLQNAFGSERLPLSVEATAQYWNGTAWVTNTQDSLTALKTSAAAASCVGNDTACACYGSASCPVLDATLCTSPTLYGFGACAGRPQPYGSLVLSNPVGSAIAVSSVVPTLSSSSLVAGKGSVIMASNGVAGWLNLNIVTPPWLQLSTGNPRANVVFGIYRGDRRIISIKELR
ncbi:MAG TPA: DUF6701 domain-containing protein [Azonexus sp.]|nr:DUF6701 domain-containing protein [Azonexus sp.]